MSSLSNLQFSSFTSFLQRHQENSLTREENGVLIIGSWIEADMKNRVEEINEMLSTIAVNPLTHCFITDELDSYSDLASSLVAR